MKVFIFSTLAHVSPAATTGIPATSTRNELLSVLQPDGLGNNGDEDPVGPVLSLLVLSQSGQHAGSPCSVGVKFGVNARRMMHVATKTPQLATPMPPRMSLSTSVALSAAAVHPQTQLLTAAMKNIHRVVDHVSVSPPGYNTHGQLSADGGVRPMGVRYCVRRQAHIRKYRERLLIHYRCSE